MCQYWVVNTVNRIYQTQYTCIKNLLTKYWHYGLLTLTMVKLFRKNSNLCDHNPPTLQRDGQTDRETDDMQDRALQ